MNGRQKWTAKKKLGAKKTGRQNDWVPKWLSAKITGRQFNDSQNVICTSLYVVQKQRIHESPHICIINNYYLPELLPLL